MIADLKTIYKLLDGLIYKFDDRSWVPPVCWRRPEMYRFTPPRSNGNLHFYAYPNIQLSENNLLRKDTDSDQNKLGYYEPEHQRITLFTNTIEHLAIEYANSKADEESLARHYLNIVTLTLIHYMASWLLHWLPDAQYRKFGRYCLVTDQQREFHDNLAQLLTYWMIRNDPTLTEVFNCIERNGESARPSHFREILDLGATEEEVINCIRWLHLKPVKNPLRADYRDETLNSWAYFVNELQHLLQMKGRLDDRGLTGEQHQIQNEMIQLALEGNIRWTKIEPYISEEAHLKNRPLHRTTRK